MKYRIEIWTIKDFIECYKSKQLNLNPPYQRKFIWSLSDQQTLIDSISSGLAIPNIFLYFTNGLFEMVDGQQRIRTILNFYDGGFKSFNNRYYSENHFPDFLNYEIPVTVIEEIDYEESIEDFYVLVNRAGEHLNRPELKRAEYFETNFLKLINKVASFEKLRTLKLFTDVSEARLLDVDFVSELITLLKEGITDKKLSVDKLFEKDITVDESKKLENDFKNVLEIIISLDNYHPLRKTRYKQRNDFYSLFSFIHKYNKCDLDFFKYAYRILIRFNDEINPSNEKCEPFQEYAFHCVSQSNSKNARQRREEILEGFFINSTEKPNNIQKKVLKAYQLDTKLRKVGINFTFNIDSFK